LVLHTEFYIRLELIHVDLDATGNRGKACADER
jgi:hypothetical protein